MMADTAVEVRRLVLAYSGQARPAVDGIDFSIARGEVFGLLGPNGAGKTSTVRVCTTLLRPTSGSVVIGGIDVLAHPKEARRQLGCVAQQASLDPSLSVRQGIYYHCRYHGLNSRLARQRTATVIERLQLTEVADRIPLFLSGGLAQRAMIARAIVHEPAVLFVDEPTTGLDPHIRLVVWDLLNQLRDTGTSILLTTHYLDEADHLCDRVAIMNLGKIVACDKPAVLKTLAMQNHVIDVETFGDVSDLHQRLENLEGVIEATIMSNGLVRVIGDLEGGLIERVFLSAQPLGLSGFTIVKPSLETVFLELTRRTPNQALPVKGS